MLKPQFISLVFNIEVFNKGFVIPRLIIYVEPDLFAVIQIIYCNMKFAFCIADPTFAIHLTAIFFKTLVL